jgi:hypothetical protein
MPPQNITRDLYHDQRCPRFGQANPERMHIELWDWMIRRRDDPCTVRQELGLGSNFTGWPDWCFVRFGMSQTVMADGRMICIAGEHEDFYDPDFCIYNDVIVLRPEPGESKVTLDSGQIETRHNLLPRRARRPRRHRKHVHRDQPPGRRQPSRRRH